MYVVEVYFSEKPLCEYNVYAQEKSQCLFIYPVVNSALHMATLGNGKKAKCEVSVFSL